MFHSGNWDRNYVGHKMNAQEEVAAKENEVSVSKQVSK